MNYSEIVYLEDESSLRMMMECMMEDFGYEDNFMSTGSPDEVFAMPNKDKVKLLILDNNVGSFTSSEHIKEFREAFPNAFIVGVTGFAKFFEGSGVDIILQKPYDMGTFEKVVAEAMSK